MRTKKTLHPIVQRLHPSPEQVGPIQARGQDIVVTAGAGTGKTRTLVARFLSLLAEGIPLRSVVAITFTKKAAREMRNRIREEVRQYLLLDGLSPAERTSWQSIYEGLDGARISTIHGLAGDILKTHPAEMGLDPAFEMLDEGQTARLKALAVEAALNWAGSDDQASRLFPIFGAWRLRRMLGELLGKRLDAAAGFESGSGDLWSVWEPILVGPIKAFIEDPVVRSGLDELAELKYDGSLDRAQRGGDALVEDLRQVIQAWEKIKASAQEGDWVRVSRSLGSLGDHLKQKGRKDNWAPADPKAVIKEIQPRFKQQIGGGEWDLAVDRKLAREIIPALGAAFDFACQWYREAKDQVSGLDFDDLEQRVLTLFREHPQVLEYWQGEIQALLVDEYQDTNARQREMVNLLNGDQGQLFIVGDGKQSIYRFRGADVAVFRQEGSRIQDAGRAYQLLTSYRSHPRLLDDLNQLLAPVLGEQRDLPYLEPFAPLSAGREAQPRIDLPAYVEVHLAAGSKGDGAGALAAEAVAARLLALVEGQPANGKGLDYGDVAVLCRASSSFSDFELAFEQAGIPYTTVSGQGFYDRPEVRDVLNALSVFADPQNDLALAGFLRSPVSRIPDPLLLDLRDFQSSHRIGCLVDAVREYAKSSGVPAGEELNAVLSTLDEFTVLAGRVTAAELISRFLLRTNYLAGLTLAGQERAANNLRKLVADAQTSGVVNMHDFLQFIQESRNIAVREGEAQLVSEGAVQIMTVHQAKGLEFPLVVLGDAAKRERLSRDILIDERLGIIPPFSLQRVDEDSSGSPVVRSGTSFAYELAITQERLKDQAESDRLLYVAATRAQDLLLVSGAVGNPTGKDQLPGLSGWIGKLAEPLGLDGLDLQVARGGSGIHHLQLKGQGLNAALAVYESEVGFDLDSASSALQEDPQRVDFDPALWGQLNRVFEDSGAKDPGSKQLYPTAKLVRESAVPGRVVGDIVHHALARWQFPEKGEKDFLDWVEGEFKSAGFYQPQIIQAGYQRVREILERFTATELYQRMNAAEVLHPELPFYLIDHSGAVRSGAMDALFQEDGRWVLVEFKTDHIRPGEEIDWSTVDYLQQVQDYLDAAEKLIDQRPEPVLCFLDYGGRVRIFTDRW